MTRMTTLVVTLVVTLGALLLAGCAGTGGGGDYSGLYELGEYQAAYDAAAPRARQRDAPDRDEAAYVAGIAAMRIGEVRAAERLLRQASHSSDEALQADALANLGLLHLRLGRHAAAARDLSQAAARLEGEERARAYYYAGTAEQRLGRWPQARTSLMLARNATSDPAMRERIAEELRVTGYTVQVGAFRERANAQRAAERIARQATELRFGSPRLVDARSPDGNALTLVQVGEFTSFQAANDARGRLNASGAIIVPLAGR